MSNTGGSNGRSLSSRLKTSFCEQLTRFFLSIFYDRLSFFINIKRSTKNPSISLLNLSCQNVHFKVAGVSFEKVALNKNLTILKGQM